MRFVRLALLALIAAPVFLGAGLGVMAPLAGQFGRASLTADILNHFAPIWLAGALLAAAAAALFRGEARALLAAVGGLGIVLSATLLLPEFLRDAGPKAAPRAAGEIKVVQFNVWHYNEDLGRAVDWLVAQDPDIAIVEETTPAFRRLMAERTDWRVACANCEVMIFSQRPLREIRQARPPRPIPAAQAMIGDIPVIGVHYAWPTDAEDQQYQEARLASMLAGVDRSRAIVAGDLNSTPWSFSRRRWDEQFGLIRRTRAVFSWPARPQARFRWTGLFPFLPIDHVYAGSGWATVKVERGPRLGSDHYPVVVTLAPVAPR
ncbi:endonuclease/exonuclease/phosphatase family protein [Phenylobacterium sp.]|jgi:endonuclease/exonuclease/phosphatase (EEP) superfamily protein YafD|uniref:endonuclease/exonuclease/phosphatase family protein n=1 Tax=Phenylobacterium sp. TaxID=1871053 RepID=UPI002F939FE6